MLVRASVARIAGVVARRATRSITNETRKVRSRAAVAVAAAGGARGEWLHVA
jgi:hypothetical protein